VFTLDEAEREHISEVVGMTKGMIAGKGGCRGGLGSAAVNASKPHEEAWNCLLGGP